MLLNNMSSTIFVNIFLAHNITLSAYIKILDYNLLFDRQISLYQFCVVLPSTETQHNSQK